MWSYNTNRDSEMQYFSTHEETVFAIMCVMRFSAVTNDIPDYYIYKDGEYVDSLEGDFLYELYIENGGVTLWKADWNILYRQNKI